MIYGEGVWYISITQITKRDSIVAISEQIILNMMRYSKICYKWKEEKGKHVNVLIM